MNFNLEFYAGKRVLITGHTGFKGTWLSVMLVNAGAHVIGYSSCSTKEVRLFDLCRVADQITHIRGDVRNLPLLLEVFQSYRPEIVIHMAAQPIVRKSYTIPVQTYETNVLGTVNVLECVRQSSTVRSFLNVTTDKVYLNKGWDWGYRENDILDGYDPYSNSKSCSELVTRSYRRSFFPDGRVAISTARAGNVIGGGDFAQDRIIPDCVRAAVRGESIKVRNPFSTRPYQHVLDPLYAYLMIAARQFEEGRFASHYNVGPDDNDCFQTCVLVDLFVKYWGGNLKWVSCSGEGPHEANFLKLDCSRLRSVFGWRPHWNLETAIKMAVQWSKVWIKGDDIRSCMDCQIGHFLESGEEQRI